MKPFLWFDKNMKEIVDYYVGIFPNTIVSRGENLSDTPSGEVEFATLTILGQEFDLMTAGPIFKFNEAVSFLVTTDNQEETDYYWNALTANGGAESECGWLKDKYGLSWQIVPKRLNELLASPEKEKAGRAMQAMLKMKKIDIAGLEAAFNQD